MDVSIVIPCYNSGFFIYETIESIEAYNGRYKYEIIIVDDGSEDKITLEKLAVIEKRYHVIHQENRGPGAARNLGVSLAKGNYILFVDSDNKINPSYIDKALDYLIKTPAVDIVYSDVTFFGDALKKRYQPAAFNIEKLILGNYIDVCAFIKKSTFENIGGFDEDKVLYIREDWELWIRAYKNKAVFHYLDEPLYYYRIRNGSLITTASIDNKKADSYTFIFNKHADLFRICYENLYRCKEFYENDKRKPFRSFLKYMNLKYFTR